MSTQAKFGTWTAYAQFIQKPILERMEKILGAQGKADTYTLADLESAHNQAIQDALQRVQETLTSIE